MKIEILGSGCKRCTALYEAASKAVKELGIEAEVIKVNEMSEIVKRGVISLPALVVDGEVKSAGKIPSKEEMKKIISGNKSK